MRRVQVGRHHFELVSHGLQQPRGVSRNGSVRDVHRLPQPLRATRQQIGNQVEISIADTGGGIPEDLKEKIFNLYFTTKEKGSGIGLAQAFRAVQMHGGAIEVESEIGKGTRFKIQLPVA